MSASTERRVAKETVRSIVKPRVPLNNIPSSALLSQESFANTLLTEQRRTERSRRGFVLMLLDCGRILTAADTKHTLEKLLCILSQSTRETDIKGWYTDGSVLGVIYTEIGSTPARSVANTLFAKITASLAATLSIEQINQITLSFYVFPEDDDQASGSYSVTSKLYADSVRKTDSEKAARILKRCMDIAGSAIALALLSPVWILIAIAIKLTSKGPILFCQQRVGHFGRQFKFFKFRSMYSANNHAIHEEYVKKLISGAVSSTQDSEEPTPIYKLTADPRVTPVGRFLRRTSFDELPQLINVLRGEMSLVGPRPPIPYEVERYDLWHKRRFLAVKPGITGLWQVKGRSRTKFDDMVRLDLNYAKSWSLWLDIKILLETPRAVVTGDGAY